MESKENWNAHQKNKVHSIEGNWNRVIFVNIDYPIETQINWCSNLEALN